MWCFYKAGQEVPAGVLSDSCSTSCNAWKRAGRFSVYPAVGAQVFYGPNGDAHTGLVYAYDATYIYTIEGNTNDNGSVEGDGVYRKKRARKDANVYGYGYPNYADPIISADPKWGAHSTGSVPSAPHPPVPPKASGVSLAHVVAAAKRDPGLPQGGTTYKADVLPVEKALVAEGLLAAKYADGSFGSLTVAAYKAWQGQLGYSGSDADGIPGKTSLTKLGEKHGFKVVT